MSEHRTRATVLSLKQAMIAAVQESGSSSQLGEYRSKPFTGFAVQTEHWEDAEWEVGRLFALLASPLGIDLSFLDTVENWDNVTRRVLRALCRSLPVRHRRVWRARIRLSHN
jgi:hypothetical protein